VRWNSLFSVSEALAVEAEGEGGKGREVAEILKGIGLGVEGFEDREDEVEGLSAIGSRIEFLLVASDSSHSCLSSESSGSGCSSLTRASPFSSTAGA